MPRQHRAPRRSKCVTAVRPLAAAWICAASRRCGRWQRRCPARQRRDVVPRLGPFRAQRHQPDKPAARLLPAPELGEVRRADMRQRMRPARPVLAAHRRPLDMDERHHLAHKSGLLPCRRDGAERGEDRVLRGRDQRRRESGDAVARQPLGEPDDGRRHQRAVVEIEPGIAVHLQVDEAGGEPRLAIAAAMLDGCDLFPPRMQS